MSVTNIWVGSWRPHKPRGPIAAHYASPGPKYALPGATGVNFHDPTKRKLPAFSFGTRHCQLRSDSSPGPRYLVPSNVTRVGRVGTPAYSLYGRTRDPQLFQTPGPDCYSTDNSRKSVFRCAPAYSISGRTKEFHNDQTPGPAAYLLPAVLGPRTVIKTTAPNYSLCGRNKIGSFHEDLQKTPGPGTYQVVDPCIYKYKPPHYSMTGRNIMPGDSTRTPGPGSHHPEQVTFTKVKAPSFTFGVRHSQYVAPLIEDVVERAL